MSNLNRPLAFIDIESTGANPRQDRIIELAVIRLLPDGARDKHVFRCNPGILIPPEAEAIHHISNADVVSLPMFAQIAEPVFELLKNCDLAGFGVARFDVPILTEEFARAGFAFPADGCRVVDAQRIFHKKEPRDLTAALSFYCGEKHVNAHGAEADTLATIKVLEAQLQKYPDLPQTIEELADYCALKRDAAWADRAGKLKWSAGEIVINFGAQYAGRKLRELAQNNAKFLKWILKSDFPGDTKKIVADALEGKFPEGPPAPASPRP
ncbi:MAG: 3'-5' exonuclease [Kiritimatiellae bacterium]|nr:3'-5' exonuclease [Kiritimatiellia bacterium]